MQKTSWSFAVPSLSAPVAVTRWGHYGMPVVLFASAGGDSLEPERLLLIQSLAGLIGSGRIKVYAIEGTAMRMLLAGNASAAERVQGLAAFDDWVAAGLVAHVRADCKSESLELLACGCAFGAASALQALLRHSQLFRGAIGLSGTYDLAPWIGPAAQCAQVSPLQGVELAAQSGDMVRLRQRTVMLARTAGDYEDPAASSQLAARLRDYGLVPREDIWRRGLHFGFASWREMLPRFVGQWV